MSNVGGVGGGTSGVLGAGYTGLGTASLCGFSPDALLEYCSSQMDNLDGQIDTLMQQQESQLNESQAVESVQTALASFGTNGPQNQSDYNKCVAAFQSAIASLPPGDPVAGQLQTQLSTMESQYGNPGQTLTTSQATELANAQAIVAQGAPAPSAPGGTPDLQPMDAYLQAQQTVSQLTAIQNGTFTAPQNGSWSGTTTALSNLDSQIKSNTQLQFLSLQNLVAQQQQAIEASTNMMTTEDQTLLDQAKAV
jgi:hypothetical protein